MTDYDLPIQSLSNHIDLWLMFESPCFFVKKTDLSRDLAT